MADSELESVYQSGAEWRLKKKEGRHAVGEKGYCGVVVEWQLMVGLTVVVRNRSQVSKYAQVDIGGNDHFRPW